MNNLSDSTSYLLENIKAQCDIYSDFARENSADPCAIVESKARSLVSLYDSLSGQIGAAIELVEFDAMQHSRLKREKEQLQKHLFSMERDLSEAIEDNVKYYAQIQALESELEVDCSCIDLEVNA